MASEAKQKRGLCCNGPNRYPERYPENSHGGIDYPPTGIDGGRYSHSRPEASGPGLGAYGPAGPSGHSPAYNGVRPHYPASAHGYYDGPSGYGSSYEHPPPYAPPYEEEYHVQHNEGHGGGGAMGNYKSLALKKLLLPLAGLAIIGVAASISHNPVLLQLGTLKGRKRRSAVFEKVYPMNPKVRRVQTNR
ncbi:uncharacterized protein LOC132705315 isoform X2 [Cylas formicarius]|uniref:uncharacterized protein LOC132705315 isoform X2 n=1 Tax=Cylas formicarius TaxID=197179 RepID=UPI002958713B|nr:uncharacterized protein LOC132705315 isoform X2 [Cylas formicarius]